MYTYTYLRIPGAIAACAAARHGPPAAARRPAAASARREHGAATAASAIGRDWRQLARGAGRLKETEWTTAVVFATNAPLSSPRGRV